MEQPQPSPEKLRRVLSLPLLVFYGVGVTIGAGIFALIGEVLRLAGNAAPISFILAGVIAGMTGLSYALLVRVFPRAGGEAVFVNVGLGAFAGRLAGLGVSITGIVSSAVIALAFAGYAGIFVPLPPKLLATGVIVVLTAIACWGVLESILFAALITLAETGVLAVTVLFGTPLIVDALAGLPQTGIALGPVSAAGVLAATVLAFFAFIGFEDIENMAEETRDPRRTAPRAIAWTLAITVLVYVAVSVVSVLAPDRAAIAGSSAPMSELFTQVSGLDGRPVAAISALAMVNGILIQMVMAARVFYGMANEGLMPKWLGAVHPGRRTPVRATLIVAAAIIALAVFFPLVRLAEMTSMVTLSVFALVNLSLFTIGRGSGDAILRRFRYWGIVAAAICVLLIAWHALAGGAAGH